MAERKVDLRPHFPFPDSIRPAQIVALEKIQEAYSAGKRFVLIEAPTGSGKSPIAIAVALALGGYILTPQKMLTQQYVNDFSKLNLSQLKGRSNYHCDQYGTDCESGSELREREPEEERDSICLGCPYKTAKAAFKDAQVGITNFDYFLLEKLFAGQLPTRSALILDEGHNTEDLILKHISISFDCGWSQRQLGVTVPDVIPGQNGDAVVEWVRNELLGAAQQHAEACDEALGDQPDSERIKKDAKEATDFVRKINYLLKQNKPQEWLFWTEDRGLFSKERFFARPLAAAPFAEEMLFSASSEMVLILSATILDPIAFQESIGIPADKCTTLRLPCEFPVQNRPIYFLPVGSMKHREKNATMPRLLEAITAILSKHSKEKGIIHAHTISNCKQIVESLKKTPHSTRVLTHKTYTEKEIILNRHTNEVDSPTVLVSPSMIEGLDLRDDLSRFQIIVKVPYGDLGSPYVSVRKNMSRRWYLWQTALKLVQATGRSVRSSDDKAVTYVLDSDFKSFVNAAAKILPKWWTDAIIWQSSMQKDLV